MSEFFEKIAAENEDLAEIFIKVAAEDVVGDMTDEERLEELLIDLENAGVDLEDPEVIEELKEASDEDIYEYNLEKALDIMSEDFLNNVEKIAAGVEPGFETAAAARAVEQYFDLNGAALLGTSFGPGNNQFGTTLSPLVDKNVFGGYGKQIITNNILPYAVNASGKIGGLIGGTNMNIIKSASDDELLDFFYTKLAEAAEFEDQTVDEFVHDLGMEALIEEIKEASEGKVGSFIKDASRKSKSIFRKKKEEEEEEKEASDIAYDYVELVADEIGADPEDLVLEYGLEKAAEYLDEVFEKEAKVLDKIKSGGKWFVTNPGGRYVTGATVGAGLGAYIGSRKGEDKDEKIKNALKGGIIGAGSGVGAAYALNTGLGARSIYNQSKFLNTPKSRFGALKEELKDQLGKLKDVSKSSKWFVTNPGGRYVTGATVGAGLGAYIGSTKGKDKDEKIKNALKGGIIGAGSGVGAAYALNTGLGARSIYNESKRNADIANMKAVAYNPEKPNYTKSISRMGALKEELKKQREIISRAGKRIFGKETRDYILGREKKSSDSFENTLYELAQQKLYNI